MDSLFSVAPSTQTGVGAEAFSSRGSSQSSMLGQSALDRRQLERAPKELAKALRGDLSEYEQAEKNLKFLFLQLMVDYKRGRNPAPVESSKVEALLQDMSESDLIYLSDTEDALLPRVRDLLSSISPAGFAQVGVHPDSDHRIAHPEKILRDFSEKKVSHYASQTETVQKVETASVTLKQVVPSVAIFRGCTGGDCSSQFSFPYPNDPHESVYFVEVTQPDGSVATKGYVSTTEVKLDNGKKGLYVVTISGNHVSAGATEVILRGLEQEMKTLGVDHILLPIDPQVSKLINYPAIQQIYKDSAQSGEVHSIEYQSPDIARRKIQDFPSLHNTGNYDYMDQNRVAAIYRPNRRVKLNVEVSLLRDHERIEGVDLNKVDAAELIDFFLQMQRSDRRDILLNLKSIPEIKVRFDIKKIDQLLEGFKGCEGIRSFGRVRLPYQKWRSQLEVLVSELSIPDPKKFLDARERMLFPGILKCSDVLSPDHQELVFGLLIADLKDHFGDGVSDLDQSDASRFLSSQKQEAPEFDQFLRELVRSPSSRSFLNRMIGLMSGADPDLRFQALAVLKILRPRDTEMLLQLIGLFEKVDLGFSYYLKQYLYQQVKFFQKPVDDRVIEALMALRGTQDDLLFKLIIFMVNQLLPPDDPRLLSILSEGMGHHFYDVQVDSLKFPSQMGHVPPFMHLKVIEALRNQFRSPRYDSSEFYLAAKNALLFSPSSDPEVWQGLIGLCQSGLKQGQFDLLRDLLIQLKAEKKEDYVEFLGEQLGSNELGPECTEVVMQSLGSHSPLSLKTQRTLAGYLNRRERAFALNSLVGSEVTDPQVVHELASMIPRLKAEGRAEELIRVVQILGTSKLKDLGTQREILKLCDEDEIYKAFKRAYPPISLDAQSQLLREASKTLVRLSPLQSEIEIEAVEMLSRVEGFETRRVLAEALMKMRSEGSELKSKLISKLSELSQRRKDRSAEFVEILLTRFADDPEVIQMIPPLIENSDADTQKTLMRLINDLNLNDQKVQEAVYQLFKKTSAEEVGGGLWNSFGIHYSSGEALRRFAPLDRHIINDLIHEVKGDEAQGSDIASEILSRDLSVDEVTDQVHQSAGQLREQWISVLKTQFKVGLNFSDHSKTGSTESSSVQLPSKVPKDYRKAFGQLMREENIRTVEGSFRVLSQFVRSHNPETVSQVIHEGLLMDLTRQLKRENQHILRACFQLLNETLKKRDYKTNGAELFIVILEFLESQVSEKYSIRKSDVISLLTQIVLNADANSQEKMLKKIMRP